MGLHRGDFAMFVMVAIVVAIAGYANFVIGAANSIVAA